MTTKQYLGENEICYFIKAYLKCYFLQVNGIDSEELHRPRELVALVTFRENNYLMDFSFLLLVFSHVSGSPGETDFFYFPGVTLAQVNLP